MSKGKKKPKVKIGQWRKGINTLITGEMKPGGVIAFNGTDPMVRYEYTPEGKFWEIPYGDGYYELGKRKAMDEKVDEAVQQLSTMYGVYIDWKHGEGDYWEFRCGSRHASMSGTTIATLNTAQLVVQLTKYLFEGVLPYSRQEYEVVFKPEKAKNPVESWADKWAKDND